jgi:hypothetical protein
LLQQKKAYCKSNSASINSEPRILSGVVGMAVDYFDGAFFKIPQETQINLILDEDSESEKCKALIKKLEI